VGGILEGAEFVRHAGGAVMAAFTLFDSKSLRIFDAVTVGIGTVVTGPAFHEGLMGTVGELRSPGGLCRINGGFEGHFLRAFISGCTCNAGKSKGAATRQEGSVEHEFIHGISPSLCLLVICKSNILAKKSRL
jgi:hypothetical protein